MTLRDIEGQRGAIETLERALKSGRTHHAYRFEGPVGVGKRTSALAFAQALLCEGRDALGCGTCRACVRVISTQHGLPQHPDLILVGRGIYEPHVLGRSQREGVEISVDQIRRIVLPHAAYPPHEGKARVFVILAADELSISAANALLKTLEEPRPATQFILVTDKPHRLLPTIHSRTLPIRFGPLPDNSMRNILSRLRQHHPCLANTNDEQLEAIIRQARGSVHLALELADQTIRQKRDDFLHAVVSCLRGPDLVQAIRFSESLDKEREQLKTNLHALAALMAQRIREEQDDGDRLRLAQAQRLALDAVMRLEAYVSPSLVFADMFIAMRRLGLGRSFEGDDPQAAPEAIAHARAAR